VESALVHHEKVAEAAVVGRPDEIKGEGIACFVTLIAGEQPSKELEAELKDHVVKEIGALARPDDIRFTDSLPKTRSGKIMRRLLRDIAGGKQTTQDTTTLEDFSVLARLREEEEGWSDLRQPHKPQAPARGRFGHAGSPRWRLGLVSPAHGHAICSKVAASAARTSAGT